jgi:cytidylate kinase
MRVDGVDVTGAIREPDVTSAVSAVSAVPATRAALVRRQREAVARAVEQDRGVVMEGRDIGTVVLPDADLKVWLYADPAVRAARRVAEDVAAGRLSDITVQEMAQELARRDHADSTRADSPTRQADDAIGVDATELTLEQVIDTVIALVDERFRDLRPADDAADSRT